MRIVDSYICFAANASPTQQLNIYITRAPLRERHQQGNEINEATSLTSEQFYHNLKIKQRKLGQWINEHKPNHKERGREMYINNRP